MRYACEAVMGDILRDNGLLFLGSRLKRLGERLQGDVLRFMESAGSPIQPSQYPILAALDAQGPLTVSDLVGVTGVSQPAVTRGLQRLAAMGLVETRRGHRDLRHKTMALTDTGAAAMARAKRDLFPQIEMAVSDIAAQLSGPLLAQLSTLEDLLAAVPLDARAREGVTAGLSILEYSEALAPQFYDINAQWIGAMFRLEATDIAVLENPRTRIIEPGGDILFVAHADLGVVGTCALQKTGERQFELTKMGVLESARGRKAGEFLLRAVLRRARSLRADRLYLLTNAACAPAIHLYEKLGFVHDAEIMREFGARYERCDVAMRFVR
jgi:DNA-binding MarR family transcriptional regulator/N-acetylglutamate synthase-like GNAT family acetyltransferase